MEMFRIGKQNVWRFFKTKATKLMKFENLTTNNLILDKSNKSRESEQYRKVIQSEDLSKERQRRKQKTV